MRKLFLILFLSGFCFAENYICLVDKITNKVSDIGIDTPKNRITWASIAGLTKEVKYFTSDTIPNYKNKLWNGTTIVNDNAQDAQDIANIKDITKSVPELIICGFLVICDYLGKNPVTFKNDVITKYNSRNT